MSERAVSKEFVMIHDQRRRELHRFNLRFFLKSGKTRFSYLQFQVASVRSALWTSVCSA